MLSCCDHRDRVSSGDASFEFKDVVERAHKLAQYRPASPIGAGVPAELPGSCAISLSPDRALCRRQPPLRYSSSSRSLLRARRPHDSSTRRVSAYRVPRRVTRLREERVRAPFRKTSATPGFACTPAEGPTTRRGDRLSRRELFLAFDGISLRHVGARSRSRHGPLPARSFPTSRTSGWSVRRPTHARW